MADLEKEKTMKELELKDLLAKHRTESNSKEVIINTFKDRELEFKKANEQLQKEKEELNRQCKQVQDELTRKSGNNEDIEKLVRSKKHVVNKLIIILYLFIRLAN